MTVLFKNITFISLRKKSVWRHEKKAAIRRGKLKD